MRLKLFVLPLAIIISISAFIMYVWPEYEAIQENSKELEKVEKVLQAAQARQANIQKLTSQMDENAQSVQVVKDYLPIGSDDEEIIHLVEQIISRSEVSLLSFSLIEGSGSDTKVTAQDRIDELTGEIIPLETLSFKRNGVSVSVAGEYDKLLEFLRKLDAAQRESDIEKYEFSVQAQEDQSSAITLAVDVTYGYAPMSKLTDTQNSGVFGQEEFDLAAVSTYQKNIRETISDFNPGTVDGRTNPFVL